MALRQWREILGQRTPAASSCFITFPRTNQKHAKTYLIANYKLQILTLHTAITVNSKTNVQSLKTN